MPVVPSFSAYAPKPNLSQAYLGGQELELGRERIRQQAASDAARISLGYAQLQQEAVANEMELAAKKEALSRQALKTAQEQEIEKAYRETQLGLAQRELKNEEAIAAMRVQEAARGFDREQRYQRRVTELSKTMPLEDAARQAILEAGGTGLSTALEKPQERAPRTYSAVAGVDPFGMQPPTRVSMTAPEFQSFIQSAPPELRTNTANVAIQGMIQPPASMTGTNQPVSSDNEVIRRTKDGRRAVFNSQTKQFIRYAD